jgi:sugar phosphate isomerase/epimerase
MINIGVAQWCLDYQGVNAVFRAASLRLSAIQIDVGGDEGAPFLDSAVVQSAYLQAVKETGVEISAIGANALNDYGMTSPVTSKSSNECWNLIQLAIDGAKNMGVKLVFLPSFAKGEIRDEIGLLRTAELLDRACSVAAKYHILIATENTLGIEGNLKLLKYVDQPNLKILLDTLNPALWGHQVPELVRGLREYLCSQIHAKDGVGGGMGNTLLNTGEANFSETIEALLASDFQGLLILENEYKQQTENRIKRDIETVQALWRQEG